MAFIFLEQFDFFHLLFFLVAICLLYDEGALPPWVVCFDILDSLFPQLLSPSTEKVTKDAAAQTPQGLAHHPFEGFALTRIVGFIPTRVYLEFAIGWRE